MDRLEWASRVKGRTAVRMLGWRGCEEDAVTVLAELARHSLVHGRGGARESRAVLHGRLSVTGARELLIDVQGPCSVFRDFSAIHAEAGCGTLDDLVRAHQLIDLVCLVEDRVTTFRAVLTARAVRL
ncbi:hypothetical protein [Streptomyces sp. NPDC046985]|uniref:hypothetical protein n=1 Tax=Streptomyces sp. NPDC046985 TaxID=3155377 RepID=UPI0033D40C95